MAMGNKRRSCFALMSAIAVALGLGACSGGSNSGDPVGTAPPPPSAPGDSGCTGSCVQQSTLPSSR